MKKRYIVGGGIAAVVAVIAVANAGGGSSPDPKPVVTSSPAVTSDAPSSVPVAPPPATDDKGSKLPILDGDWKLQSIRISADFEGDFQGTARVTYAGEDPSAENSFTITVFKGGKDVATLDGFASGVAPGGTVSVDLISEDHYVSGPFLYDFQNDW